MSKFLCRGKRFRDRELSLLFKKDRTYNQVNLIASENYVTQEVVAAQSSYLMNKYAEGYPHKRYYQGCHLADQVEELALKRLKSLFGVNYANVQPHSGSQANQAVMLALLQPGDRVLSLALDHGGHLTHGHHLNSSGKIYKFHFYQLDRSNKLCYESIRTLALEIKPKMIITGYSAYPHIIDFRQFRDIAHEVGAYLLADIAHLAGLIAGGCYPSPVPYADIITGTTHKVLRGPRGGIIIAANKTSLTAKIDRAVFPGIQGGPMMHTIAAKAVAFREASLPDYRLYTQQVIANARTILRCLSEAGVALVFNSTDTHLVMIDLSRSAYSGKMIANYLERIEIITNHNLIPNDPRGALEGSGIRLGTAAITTLGFKEEDCRKLASIITDSILDPQESLIEHRKSLVGQLLQDVLGRN